MNLLEAMNIEYGLSKRWLKFNLLLTFTFYCCVVSAAVVPPAWIKWITLTAFAIQLGIASTRFLSNAHYALGESVRRPAMLQNGLGTAPSRLQLAKIHAKHGIAFSGNPITSQKYYESKTECGPRRLIEITEESAFWTGELAERMATVLRYVLIGAMGSVALFVFAALESGLPASRGDSIARIGMATITVWCTGELFSLYKKYDSLARGAQRVLNDCEAISARAEVDFAAAVTFGEYNCCLASAAVIPGWIYKYNQNKLNVAWASRNANEIAESQTS
jgi:hypothetical protein